VAELPDNETRARLLDVAERLFARRGYAAVRLREIAAEVGIHHASLYYYAPAGKRQLFIEVMERSFERHRAGLTDAIRQAGTDIRDQLRAVAAWLVAQPPLDLSRMAQADMEALDRADADRLMTLAYDALRLPIVEALEAASSAGLILWDDLDLAAMGLVSLAQSVHSVPFRMPDSMRASIGQRLADMYIDGLLTR
jgi:AcrR family transcriptional regulator